MDDLLQWHHRDGTIESIAPITNTDAVLQLHGILLAQEYQRSRLHDVQKLRIWTCMLRLASNEGSDLSTRSAVASSIQGFQTVLRQHDSKPLISAELLDVCFCLYNTLIDDDEEIRDQGASIVSWVLSEPSSNTMPKDVGSLSLSPIAANARLLDFFVSSYGDSTALCIEALRRLNGMRCLESLTPLDRQDNSNSKEPLILQLTPLKSLLAIARREDTALFVEEKQNLFVDEVQEAERWAGVLQRLSSVAISSRIALEMETWVLDGLAILIDTASNEFDGPLGWTTKPAVFTLGMQAILAAEVMFCWSRNGYCEINDEKLQNAVFTLKQVGERSSLHVIWLKELRRIIGGSSMSRSK